MNAANSRLVSLAATPTTMEVAIIALFLVIGADAQTLETWTGRWLPERTTKSSMATEQDISDFKHGVKMGVSSSRCDDAKTNLTLDWDYSPINHTCFAPTRLAPSWDTRPLIQYENIPKHYFAHHSCMNTTINYDRDIPTFGTHRALWPRYGEYRFVPRQRWLHNLEHGAVVMLYHPCAHPVLVERLRLLVVNCLRRHVITPFTLLLPDRPLALVTWGARISMATVNSQVVQDFIEKHALNGPEKVSRDGQYDLELTHPADIVSDIDDSALCSNLGR